MVTLVSLPGKTFEWTFFLAANVNYKALNKRPYYAMAYGNYNAYVDFSDWFIGCWCAGGEI